MVNALNKEKVNLVVTFLRIFIGWHFLYEGVIKLYNPEWTSFGYLATAQGPLKPFFALLIGESVIGWVDALNIIALLVVGATFLLGFWERFGAVVGIGLLALYYLAHPPFPWLAQLNVEGNYWFVNKNLIELIGCILIYYYPTGHFFGLGHLKTKEHLKIEQS
ncbi:DoxX family membrane protein [Muricauda sp. MAR_2010_75]|jgi:thiosulfate dehydrogenase [quinone] large subunit|uniref:DoxX family membrane protein n=1 Tax=Allomuricauda sp. MAR_2010_75 TaxID=1250232 RepID=UPI000B1809A7|nr:DoxX family membrane protein [Muricauda sp. MAR_2010_75]